MTSKIFVAVFAIFIEIITGQSIGKFNAGLYGNRGMNPIVDTCPSYSPMPNLPYGACSPSSPMAYDAQGLCLGTLAASRSGGLSVTSSSPISPNGVFLQSENMVIEGPLAVNGQLPFLGTIAVEGSLPALGNGDVMYECGNGNVGILNEEYPSVAPTAYNSVGSNLGPGMAGPFGYTGLSGFGRVL
ncbi:unnamed protein product, partial [Brenthis ino]